MLQQLIYCILLIAQSVYSPDQDRSKPGGDMAAASQTVLIGTYNVENLWDSNDLNTSSTYDDYSGTSSNWIKDNMVRVKAERIADAIRLAGNPDILGLQEIESAENKSESLEALKPFLVKAGYQYFALGQQEEDNPVAVTTAVVSKFPIIENDNINFSGDDSARDPQVVTIDVAGSPVRVYVNHWKSKRGSDSAATEAPRIAVAKIIHDDIQAVRAKNPSLDCVVIGDFNSNYNETQRYEIAKSGIVEGLLSTGDERMMIGATSDRLYNLWFDLQPERRGSYSYSDELNTIDSILISDSLYDKAGLQYIPKSFKVIGHEEGSEAARKLMNADGSPLRWQVAREGTREKPYTRHTGIGYSDHLPLVAEFKVINGHGTADKIELENPSTTEFGTSASRQLIAPACDRQQAVDLRQLDISNEDSFGACVRYADGQLLIRRDGLFGVKVDLGGYELGLSMTYGYGTNKDFLRNELQNAVGKNLNYVVGRIGYRDGKLTVFANDPNDIRFK